MLNFHHPGGPSRLGLAKDKLEMDLGRPPALGSPVDLSGVGKGSHRAVGIGGQCGGAAPMDSAIPRHRLEKDGGFHLAPPFPKEGWWARQGSNL